MLVKLTPGIFSRAIEEYFKAATFFPQCFLRVESAQEKVYNAFEEILKEYVFGAGKCGEGEMFIGATEKKVLEI